MCVHQVRSPMGSRTTPSPSVLLTDTISTSAALVAVNCCCQYWKVCILYQDRLYWIKCQTKGHCNGQDLATLAPETGRPDGGERPGRPRCRQCGRCSFHAAYEAR